MSFRRDPRQRVGHARQTIYFTIASALGQLFTAVTYALAARWSSPHEYGYAVSGIAAALLIAGIVDFGCNAHAVREVAALRMTREEMSRRQTVKLLTVVFVGFVAQFFVPRFAVWLLLVGVTAAYSQAVQSPLRGIGSVHRVAYSLIVERASLLFAFLILSRVVDPQEGLLIATVASSVLGTVCTICQTPKAWRLRLLASRSWPWRGAGHFGFFSVATTVQGFDLPVLAFRAGEGAAGVFGAVNRWVGPMALVANAFSAAAFPILSAAGGSRAAWTSLRKSLWLLLGAAVACLLVVAGAPLLTHALLGEQYSTSSGVLRLLALGTLLSLPNQLAVTVLLARRHDKLVSNAMALVVCSQLGAVWFLSPRFGADTAAWAFLVSQIALLATVGPFTYREVRQSRNQRASDQDQSVT